MACSQTNGKAWRSSTSDTAHARAPPIALAAKETSGGGVVPNMPSNIVCEIAFVASVITFRVWKTSQTLTKMATEPKSDASLPGWVAADAGNWDLLKDLIVAIRKEEEPRYYKEVEAVNQLWADYMAKDPEADQFVADWSRQVGLRGALRCAQARMDAMLASAMLTSYGVVGATGDEACRVMMSLGKSIA